ncbi:hypothetical protein BH11MYX3_BH11MYX3_34450 [soil metagenome]
MNHGAQRCVIHRVTKYATVVFFGSSGSKFEESMRARGPTFLTGPNRSSGVRPHDTKTIRYHRLPSGAGPRR